MSRPGPSPVLAKEEEELVQWVVKMSEIGYGQCRQQVCSMVKRLLDKTGRPNPFPDNLPGKTWWYSFLKRHPQLSSRTPQPVENYRAKSCTPSTMNAWYNGFEQFLLRHDLLDKPHCIWNCDESGFSLCPKTGKVLAARGTPTVYYNTSGKGQITTLVCISAAGGIIPPMHIFPGVRFGYNPMEGCVEGSYFGKSENGWITTELFNGWLKRHFVSNIPPQRPVCLLVDGHSSHIDLDTSKFCKENGILLYCLPPHSSHITQPLDVGFFSPLKGAWSKSVMVYNSENPGAPVSKYCFARVFRIAYLKVVKPETIVNAFKHAGIYPPNRKAIDERKLYPSQVYHRKETEEAYKPVAAKKLALMSLEEELDEATIKKFESRIEEGYDCTDDLLYLTWKKLKLQCSSKPSGDHTNQKTTRVPFADLTNQQATTTHNDIFQIPAVATTETRPPKTIRGTACLPKHISSDEVIKLLEEKKAKREMEERQKEERQQQREERKKKKEEEKNEKARKKEERQKEQRKKKEQKENEKEERKKKKEQKKQEQDNTEEECECPICNIPYSDECETSTIWIECEVCGKWYHLECTGLEIENTSEDIEFICQFCV